MSTYFLAATASTTHPQLMKLILHMLGTSIILFQGTPKITLDTQ